LGRPKGLKSATFRFLCGFDRLRYGVRLARQSQSDSSHGAAMASSGVTSLPQHGESNGLRSSLFLRLGWVEAELLELAVDLGGSPIRILVCEASDQHTNFFGDLRSAAAWPRSPTPVEAETGAMPADDGRGLHDDEDLGPAGPEAAKGTPEESVQPVPSW